MAQEKVKKLFVEVNVNWINVRKENVLLASGFEGEGAYGKLDEWGGLGDLW